MNPDISLHQFPSKLAIKTRFCLPYSQKALISSGEGEELPAGMARAWTLAQVTRLALTPLLPVSHAVLRSHLGMNSGLFQLRISVQKVSKP